MVQGRCILYVADAVEALLIVCLQRSYGRVHFLEY